MRSVHARAFTAEQPRSILMAADVALALQLCLHSCTEPFARRNAMGAGCRSCRSWPRTCRAASHMLGLAEAASLLGRRV